MRTAQTKTCISTFNGDFFDYENPEGHDFDIESIAHALSNLCRYGGHSNEFYSVAEHSILVSRMVGKPNRLCGLLHDASEAYCGDVPSPLKRLIPDYRKIEDRTQQAIAKRFGLPYPFPEEVHLADKTLYRTERAKLCAVADELWFVDLPVTKIKIACYSPKVAKRKFLERYEELNNERNEQVRREREAGNPPSEPSGPRLVVR